MTRFQTLTPLFLAAALLSCSNSGDKEDCGDRCDEVDTSNAACLGKVVDGSNTSRSEASILSNGDHFAQLVLLEGDACPSKAVEVMAKLNDGACGSEANGTMMVNEKSSHDSLSGADADTIAEAENFNRAVISRQCAIPERNVQEGEQAACVGADVEEFDFVMDACIESSNTPNCFEDESGARFFDNPDCVECLTRGDDRLHKGDLRTGEDRCLDRDAVVADNGGRPPAFNMLFSVFTGKDEVAESGMEVIAFDKTEGVFNFYKENSGGWAFLGNSRDYQEGKGGFCRECHPSGGLVQKELDSPWMNWEINGDVPHSDDVINKDDASRAFFGSEFPLGGEGLEFDIVRPGNELMNERRLERMEARVRTALDDSSSGRASLSTDASPVYTAEEMHEFLKPLFCTEQINIITGTFGGDGLFNNDLLDTSGSINIPSGEYSTVIEELGQIRGSGALTSTDSPDRLARPSNGDVFDDLYRNAARKDLVSSEFIQNVLFVDFTRPLFSDARCDLLEHAPEVTVGELKSATQLATAIVSGFIKNLEAAGSLNADETEFLAALKNDDNSEARSSAYETFNSACNARGSDDPKAFMTDVVKMADLMRRETENRLEIVEGFLAPHVWPRIPGLQFDFSRWNQTTCELE